MHRHAKKYPTQNFSGLSSVHVLRDIERHTALGRIVPQVICDAQLSLRDVDLQLLAFSVKVETDFGRFWAILGKVDKIS